MRPQTNVQGPAGSHPDVASFLQRLMLTTAVVIGVILVVKLADVLLLIFGAVLVAVLLQAIAAPLRSRLGLGRTLSLMAAVAIVAAAIATVTWAFGQQLERQLVNLADLLPAAWDDFKRMLGRSPLGGILLEEVGHLPGPDGRWLAAAQRLAAEAASGLVAAIIVLFAGLYLAFHPQAYANGLVRLFPLAVRARTVEVLDAAHEALRRWLLSQLVSMALVGGTTALGLWLVGVPSAIGLGVLAGVGQFIPVVGPMAATVPGLLIALTAGPQTFGLAAAVYLGASQLEANVIAPIVLRQMAELPMAVTLFAVLGMGVLLGPLGVLFATPLAVVAYVLVKKIYVEGVLGETPDRRVRP